MLFAWLIPAYITLCKGPVPSGCTYSGLAVKLDYARTMPPKVGVRVHLFFKSHILWDLRPGIPMNIFLLPVCFMLVSCLTYFLALKKEATCSSETLVAFQRITWRYILEDRIIHNQHYENHIYYINLIWIRIFFSWCPRSCACVIKWPIMSLENFPSSSMVT
jgi:hypothetical protein